MGIINFIKEAGQKIWHSHNTTEDKTAIIKEHIAALNLPNTAQVDIQVDADGSVTLNGSVDSQSTADKLVVAVGNVAGVSNVNNALVAQVSGTPMQYYNVKEGDTLSAISLHFYGSANHYQAIFESNQPMLSHPDKIYPGQKLLIPAQSTE